jgi:alkanesulfonate monooxygenase SsuD/methylene tetrahydromethanopterin reductase-like flavin-dependent oxidoreductase (luciferase family)
VTKAILDHEDLRALVRKLGGQPRPGEALGPDRDRLPAPIARWIGCRRPHQLPRRRPRPIVLAGGQPAVTERPTVFSIIHTAFNPPLVAAKEIATLDQIGPGRVGLKAEAEAFTAEMLELFRGRRRALTAVRSASSTTSANCRTSPTR